MPNPLSVDIRIRFRRLYDEGLSGREIGRRPMISAASASRLAQKIRQGVGLAPAPPPARPGVAGPRRSKVSRSSRSIETLTLRWQSCRAHLGMRMRMGFGH